MYQKKETPAPSPAPSPVASTGSKRKPTPRSRLATHKSTPQPFGPSKPASRRESVKSVKSHSSQGELNHLHADMDTGASKFYRTKVFMKYTILLFCSELWYSQTKTKITWIRLRTLERSCPSRAAPLVPVSVPG